MLAMASLRALPSKIGLRPFMMLFLADLDAEKGWTKQLHIGALRAVEYTRGGGTWPQYRLRTTIGDQGQAASLCRYLECARARSRLPKNDVYKPESRR